MFEDLLTSAGYLLTEAPVLQEVKNDADPKAFKDIARQTRTVLKRVKASHVFTGSKGALYSGSVGSAEIDFTLTKDGLFITSISAVNNKPEEIAGRTLSRPESIGFITYTPSADALEGKVSEDDARDYNRWLLNPATDLLSKAVKIGRAKEIDKARKDAEAKLKKARKDWPVGTVVSFKRKGAKRRYAVSGHGYKGHLHLTALSGSLQGSHPTDVKPSEVKRHSDQKLEFTGSHAGKLKRRFKTDVSMYGPRGAFHRKR